MSPATDSDLKIIRDLARQYAEAASKEIQDQRRDLWRRHNSLEPTRPLIYMRVFACSNEIIDPQLQCEDPFLRAHERWFRQMLFQDWLEDDYILEPWITQRASFIPQGESEWGPAYGRHKSAQQGGSWKYDPPLKDLDDIDKLTTPAHMIDEDKTAENVERLQDAVGDIIEVNIDRGPVYHHWAGDISTHLAHLRGLEQLMWDMADNPEWLHRLLAHMRDGILKAQAEAEAAGDWRLCNHSNQAMPYSKELQDPTANSEPVKRDQLWLFMAAQEFALISPEMHDEFLLEYQIPILEKFALTAYGCCEDLTRKIDILRRIPNLRRIAVTPWADVQKCAEQINTDYVISWRPSPADTVCTGFDPDKVREILTQGVEACKGLHLDITLKDVQTVQNDPERLRKFVRIAREVIGRQ